jgi:4-alpha-glucanotransferase
MRSRQSWGIGDLADLRRLGNWSADELGAAFILVSPFGADLPGLPQQASPYSPSSRRFLNLLYLRIEDIPGAREAGIELESLARAARGLNARREIERDRIYEWKLDALERLWKRRRNASPELDRYLEQGGESLRCFALHSTLVENHYASTPGSSRFLMPSWRPPVSRLR